MFFRRVLTWIVFVAFITFVLLMFVTPIFPIFSWALPLTTGDGPYIIFFVLVLLISLLSLAQKIDFWHEAKTPKIWDGTEVPNSAKPMMSKIFSAAIWYNIGVSVLFILIAIVGLGIVITR